MVKVSILNIISTTVAIMFLYSCCEKPHKCGLLQPEWLVTIPTYDSAEIFYDGLPNLPRNNDIILAHTTIFDGGFQHEDNRLCAINIKTGNISWYFPSDLAVRNYCIFDGKGYAHNSRFVFQYRKNGTAEDLSDTHTTICLNANNGDVIWALDGCSNMDSINKDVVGENNDCYFVHGDNLIYKANLSNDSIDVFYSSDTLHISGICLGDGYLVVFAYLQSSVEYMRDNYCLILNRETSDAIAQPIYVGTSDVECHGLVYDGVLYVNLDRKIAAIDISNNNRLWERYDEGAYGLMDMYIYKDILLKCGINETIGYDKITGDIRYDYRDYGSWYTNMHKGYAYMVNRKDILVVFDVLTGKMMDYVICPNGEGFLGSYPVVYDDKLYIMGGNNLYRYPTYPF